MMLVAGCYAAACVYSVNAWYLYIWHNGTMKTLGKAKVLS